MTIIMRKLVHNRIAISVSESILSRIYDAKDVSLLRL